MDIFEAIESRHSVRKFKSDQVPLKDIEKIINAARLAPSSTNAQMWHFIVITDNNIKDKMKQAIVQIYDEVLSWKESEGYENKINFYKQFSTFFTDVPVNIAVLTEPKESVMEEILKKKGFSQQEILRRRPHPALLSVGAAIENISLAAHALGYGTCWLTALIHAYSELEKILDVKPPFQLVSFLCLGVPEESNGTGPVKKELSEIMTVL